MNAITTDQYIAAYCDACRSVNAIGEMRGDAPVLLNKSAKAPAGLHSLWPETVQHGLIKQILQSSTVN